MRHAHLCLVPLATLALTLLLSLLPNAWTLSQHPQPDLALPQNFSLRVRMHVPAPAHASTPAQTSRPTGGALRITRGLSVFCARCTRCRR
jgi:hypothetical protein